MIISYRFSAFAFVVMLAIGAGACGTSTERVSESTLSETEGIDSPSGEELQALLGTPIDAESVKEFFNLLGYKEVEQSGKYPHWIFAQGGVEVVVNTDDNTIHAIFLMGNSPGTGFSTYGGFLPENLSWSMTRSEIEGQLGSGIPRPWGREPVIQYKDLGIEIEYVASDSGPADMRMRLLQVRTF